MMVVNVEPRFWTARLPPVRHGRVSGGSGPWTPPLFLRLCGETADRPAMHSKDERGGRSSAPIRVEEAPCGLCAPVGQWALGAVRRGRGAGAHGVFSVGSERRVRRRARKDGSARQGLACRMDIGTQGPSTGCCRVQSTHRCHGRAGRIAVGRELAPVPRSRRPEQPPRRCTRREAGAADKSARRLWCHAGQDRTSGGRELAPVL
jgi:hypothetical protein